MANPTATSPRFSTDRRQVAAFLNRQKKKTTQGIIPDECLNLVDVDGFNLIDANGFNLCVTG